MTMEVEAVGVALFQMFIDFRAVILKIHRRK